MRRKKKVKELEKRLKYCFDLLINLSLTVARLQKEHTSSEVLSCEDNSLSKDLNIKYSIVK